MDRTTRERLIESRDLLEVAMNNAAPDELPPLVREYRAVLAALDALPNPDAAEAKVDELRRRREERERARQAGASAPVGSPGVGRQ